MPRKGEPSPPSVQHPHPCTKPEVAHSPRGLQSCSLPVTASAHKGKRLQLLPRLLPRCRILHLSFPKVHVPVVTLPSSPSASPMWCFPQPGVHAFSSPVYWCMDLTCKGDFPGLWTLSQLHNFTTGNSTAQGDHHVTCTLAPNVPGRLGGEDIRGQEGGPLPHQNLLIGTG